MRIAVLSDVHANLEALDAVLASADEAGVQATYVLGDLVGYNADPVPVLERLTTRPSCTLIAGNHDLAATGRFDTTWFNRTASVAIEWTSAQLTPAARTLLEGLEPSAEGEAGLLVHGSAVDPAAEYVTNEARARASFDAVRFDCCFFGHTHMPTLFWHDGDAVHGRVLQDGEPVVLEPGWRAMLNPGSVGQPRDGDPRASLLVYDTQARIARVHRVAYDIERTQAKIIAADLPPVLAHRLADGR